MAFLYNSRIVRDLLKINSKYITEIDVVQYRISEYIFTKKKKTERLAT